MKKTSDIVKQVIILYISSRKNNEIHKKLFTFTYHFPRFESNSSK